MFFICKLMFLTSIFSANHLTGTNKTEPNYYQVQLKTVKFSHTRYRALGPELIRCTGSQRAASDFLSHPPAVGCHYFLRGLRSPSVPSRRTSPSFDQCRVR